MVWELVHTDTLRGPTRYYILAQGTYKVGRKDCDVIVQMDIAVSRVHAEIIVDKMISHGPHCTGHTYSNSHVRVRDSSKYGTFVNKELGPKAVRLHHGDEARLKEGDTVTFGTGNATFRFCCVPLRIFISSAIHGQLRSIQATASSIGVAVTSNSRTEYTHVLVNESSSVTTELIEAVLAKKLVVLPRWFEVLAEKKICTELPSCSAYVPSLNVEDNMVKIVDPKFRENCLEGYTFVLASSDKYKFGDKLQLLLKMIGARFVNADEFLLNSQISADRDENRVVLVIPEEFTNGFSHARVFSSLSRITDIKLLAAVLSGHLESSVMQIPSIIISSSHSTDETIVADSDAETDTALSPQAVAKIKSEFDEENHASSSHSVSNIRDEPAEETHAFSSRPVAIVKPEPVEDDRNHAEEHRGVDLHRKNGNAEEIARADVILTRKFDKRDASHVDKHENSDILYSQGLIIRNATTALEPVSSSTAKPVDFKLFRKRETVSGNSFRDLIPFSKDPYNEADYGRDESEGVRDERKRRRLEAIAEELFNSEKLKKRAAAGASLESFFSRP